MKFQLFFVFNSFVGLFVDVTVCVSVCVCAIFMISKLLCGSGQLDRKFLNRNDLSDRSVTSNEALIHRK